MAEFRKLPTQAELQNMLFMEQMRVKNPQQIAQEALASGTTVSPIPENVFQKIAGGVGIAKEYVNRAGSAADLAKLFPGYKPQTKVTIPTGYNFAPKQDPMGGVIPGGLQTQDMNLGQVLGAIKPADVLGISGAERAYSDIGAGKAPQPLDVLDVAGLGATGLVGGKAALKTMKGMPVGLSIQEAKGLLTEAPRSPLGFYSALEESALNLQRNKGSGQAFLNDLQKAPNVKADEVKWTGLDEFLKTKPNVTKQEVQDYLANNRVEVQEVRSTVPRLPGEEMPGDKGAFLPKFGSYTLPGGENYREILLTMPAKQKLPEGWEIKHFPQANQYALYNERGEQVTRRPTSEQLMEIASKNTGENYSSSHFPDQPNILAHLRVNDRVDADGKKMLLIEEVQSDWHQAGREKGYQQSMIKKEDIEAKFIPPNVPEGHDPRAYVGRWELFDKRTGDRITQASGHFDEEQAIRNGLHFWEAHKKGVPNAPFKDSWYQLALKRAVQYAAENGYDRIGLTTGSQQAARFDLSKQISYLSIKPKSNGMVTINASKDGEPVIIKDVSKDQLADYIGKDMAKKAISDIDAGKNAQYSDLDLQVGGEGMKKYYDEIYPKFLDKYGKKWNARVGETKVNTVMEANPGSMMPVMGQEGVRYLDVTPEMKSSVSKGQPLFQALPAIPATGLLATQDENR